MCRDPVGGDELPPPIAAPQEGQMRVPGSDAYFSVKIHGQLPGPHVQERLSQSFIERIKKLLEKLYELFFGKITPLAQERVNECREWVETLPLHLQEQIHSQLIAISDCERKIIGDLRSHIGMTDRQEKEILHHILSGAYVVLEDGGATYARWSKFEGISRRVSSHASTAPQYAVRGAFVKECLFSENQLKEGGLQRTVSWFQFERHPTGWRHGVAHFWSYVLYKLSGENQGPYGSSQYTESNPLILTLNLP